MWSKTVAGLVTSGLLLTTQAAFADHHEWHDWRDHDRPYEGAEYEYARVVNVEPIVREVRVSTPHQECWTETRSERHEYNSVRETHPAAGSMILGGIIGAAIGNQIGAGDGRRAATVAGAIIGTAIGHEAAERRNSGYVDTEYTEERPHDVQRCEVRYDDSYEQHIDGYRVTYVYEGREFTTRLPYDPGDRIQVRADREPEHCDCD